MQFGQQKKPCRNKGQCRSYLANKDCPFSHDPCRHLPNCNKGPQCRYFHPNSNEIPQNINKQSNFFAPSNPSGVSQQKRLPVGKTLCKFGMKCNKRESGQCFFIHSSQSAPVNMPFKAPINYNTPCKYQDECLKYKNNQCKYIHNVPNQQANKKQVQKTQLSICADFMFNRCGSQQECLNRQKHSFTKNNFIKRIFFSTKIQRLVTDIKLLYIDRATYYVFQNSNVLSFMKFNQLDSMFEAAIDYQLTQQSPIQKLCIEQSLICYVVQNEIVFYRPKQGQINRVNSQHRGPILHFTMLDDKIALSYAQNEMIKAWVNGNFSNELSLKMSSKIHQSAMGNIIFLKKVQIMGERIIVGGSPGLCILWNKQLQSQVINIEDRIIIDAACVVNKAHPFCILTTINNKLALSEIIVIDLICLEVNCLVSKKIDFNDERFEKILTIQQNCLIQMSTGCVVIYLIPSFQEYNGLIGFTNKILTMDKTKDNKIIILEASNQNSQGSLSIYKLQ